MTTHNFFHGILLALNRVVIDIVSDNSTLGNICSFSTSQERDF